MEKAFIRNHLQHNCEFTSTTKAYVGSGGETGSRAEPFRWNADADDVRPGKLHAGFQHGDGGQRVQLAQFKKDIFEADELL